MMGPRHEFFLGIHPRPLSVEGEAEALTAVEDVYRSQFGYVWNTLRRMGVPRQDIEDVIHDVFVVVHRRISDYQPKRPIRPWLFGIAYRVCSGRKRQARRRPVELGPTADRFAEVPARDEPASAQETRDQVREALLAVGDLDQRAVLVMHDIDGHSVPEIAQALEVPLNTVYSRLRLARNKFTAALRRLCDQRGES